MDLSICTHQQSHPPILIHRIRGAAEVESGTSVVIDKNSRRSVTNNTISQALHSLNGSYPPPRLNLALGQHATVHVEKRKTRSPILTASFSWKKDVALPSSM